jgi:AcrR family transcriptional regulator
MVPVSTVPVTGRRPVGRPRDVDSAETRSAVVAAARSLFARDGFAATTNQAIARAAGITTSAIYHYFPSKADLFVAAYHETVDAVQDRFAPVTADTSTDLFTRFLRALEIIVEVNNEDPTLMGFVLSTPRETRRHPELKEAIHSAGRHREALSQTLTAQAGRRGELAPDVDVDSLNDLLNTIMAGVSSLSLTSGDPQRSANVVAMLRRLFAGTLTVSPER